MLARNSHFLNEPSQANFTLGHSSSADQTNAIIKCHAPGPASLSASLPASLPASLLPLAPPPELAKWHLLRLFCGTEKLHVTQRLTGHFWQHRQQDRQADWQTDRLRVGQTARTNVNSKHWKMRQATEWEIKLIKFATTKECAIKGEENSLKKIKYWKVK